MVMNNTVIVWISSEILSLIKFCFHSRELDFGNNPLLKSAIYTSLPDKVKLIIQDHLVTPRKSLEQLAYDHNWLATMKKSARDIPCSIELPQGKQI